MRHRDCCTEIGVRKEQEMEGGETGVPAEWVFVSDDQMKNERAVKSEIEKARRSRFEKLPRREKFARFLVNRGRSTERPTRGERSAGERRERGKRVK